MENTKYFIRTIKAVVEPILTGHFNNVSKLEMIMLRQAFPNLVLVQPKDFELKFCMIK